MLLCLGPVDTALGFRTRLKGYVRGLSEHRGAPGRVTELKICLYLVSAACAPADLASLNLSFLLPRGALTRAKRGACAWAPAGAEATGPQ